MYSAEKKVQIVLELLKEEQTVAQLASKYQITAKTITNLKKQFLENAVIAMEPAKAVSEYKAQIDAKDEEISDLQKALGKATIKAEWAEGKLKSLDYKTKKALIKSELNISIQDQCDALSVSRSSFYYTPKPMSNINLQILNSIDEIYTDNPEYGYRYIHQQLLEDGFSIGKDRVLKYMQLLGINAIYPHKKKLTSIKDEEHFIYKYLLKEYWTVNGRSKTVHVPNVNEVWSGDITYIRTNGGFVYLAAVIDWHSKAVLSYKISNSMDATLATDVLKDALAKYPKPKIFNSDQGSQYTSYEHTKVLKDNDVQISMNGKGRSIDNIIIERFFRTLKHNNIYISDYQSIKDLKQGVSDYIYKYNFKRFHSSLNYKKPMNVYLEQIKNVA
ncbi:MAG: IS3 family transposase [Arcobacter sp.]|nr:IS3 family transposase [Arcobacter sp.]